MTVNELIQRLEKVPAHRRDLPIVCWLPGSRIDLKGLIGMTMNSKEFLIEGSVREGSVLSDVNMGR